MALENVIQFKLKNQIWQDVHLVAARKNPAAKQTDKAALLPRPALSCNKRSGQTAFLNFCILRRLDQRIHPSCYPATDLHQAVWHWSL